MWFIEYDRYFNKIEKFAYGEITESNPHPWTTVGIVRWGTYRTVG